MADEQSETKARLTIRTLREMVASMLRIYPPLKQKIDHFETLVVQHFTDEDVTALKNIIIEALRAIRSADMRELQQVSELSGITDSNVQRRLRALLGLIQTQISRLKILEHGIEVYERAASPELTRVINRLKDELAALLAQEQRELAELEHAA